MYANIMNEAQRLVSDGAVNVRLSDGSTVKVRSIESTDGAIILSVGTDTVDPGALLSELRDLVSQWDMAGDPDVSRAVTLFRQLDEYLSETGALPTDWAER